MFLLGFILYGTLHFVDLSECSLSNVREVFSYNLFKDFLRFFLSLFSSGTPVMGMSVCLMLSQRSLRLSSILFFLFSLLCFAAVISTILSSTPLIPSSASVILLLILSRVFLISFIVLLIIFFFCFSVLLGPS